MKRCTSAVFSLWLYGWYQVNQRPKAHFGSSGMCPLSCKNSVRMPSRPWAWLAVEMKR